MPHARIIRLLVLCWSCVSAAAAVEEIPAVLSASKVRGAVVAVLHESGETEIITHGDDGRAPVTAETRFRAGSVSKLVTSCLVLRMERAGLLRVTDRVNDLQPGLMEDATTRVEHLLEHTAGLAGSSYADYAMQMPAASPSAYVMGKAPFRARWRPGLHYSYANDGHTIAAAILEKLSNTDFDTLVRREVFLPLGMERSGFLPDAALSLSYERDGKTETARWEMPFRPSGALVTTAGDLARLGRMLLAEGRLQDGTEFLSTEAVARMHRAETSAAGGHGLHDGAYGLGNFTFVAAGHPFRGHWGRTEGFQANFGYLPGSGRGFVMLVNTDDRTTVTRLREAIATSLTRDLPPAPRPQPSGDPPPFPADGIYTNASHGMPLRGWLFGLLEAKRIRTTPKGLKISGIIPGTPPSTWIATGPNRYQAEGLPVATGTFLQEGGRDYWIDGESYLHRPAAAVYPLLILLPAGLLAAAGGVLWTAGSLVSRVVGGWPLSRPVLFTGFSGLMFLLLAAGFTRYGLGGPYDAAALGRPGVVSIFVLVASVAGPLAAAAAVVTGCRSRRWWTLILSVPLLLLSIFLAAVGWCPLITFA